MHNREDLFEILNLHKYPKQVYVKLFYMLTSNNESYTSNSNGIFFNLQNVSDIVIDEVTKYISDIYNNIESYNKTSKDRQEQIDNIQDNLPCPLKKVTKTKTPLKKSITPEGIKNPFIDISYTGVHKRIDNILKGRVNIVPCKKQKTREPGNVDDVDIDVVDDVVDDDIDDDLFGETDTVISDDVSETGSS